MIVRCNLAPIPFVPLVLALAVPACFNPPTVDPGPRVIADFDEDGGLVDGAIEPTWSLFSPWTCSASRMSDQDNVNAGPDGGPRGEVDAGQPTGPDGGQPVSCTLGLGDPDMLGLWATFDAVAPGKGQKLVVEVTTQTMSRTVDFSAFQRLLFDARLDPTADPFPMGTELRVELGCATTKYHVDWYVPLFPLWNPFSPLLSAFQGTNPLMDQSCLAHVDSIGFAVLFSSPTGTSMIPIAGTLRLDSIELK
jgi:hypothetical protein